mgnify:FL=1
MGSLQATEMAELMPMEQALEWHLRSNHFPPVPSSMVKPCLEAIDAYWEDDLDRLISLPEGVGYRGLTVAPARAIIINHHLDAWCSEDDSSEDY